MAESGLVPEENLGDIFRLRMLILRMRLYYLSTVKNTSPILRNLERAKMSTSTMTLIDFSQVVIASAMDYNRKTKESIDIDLLRHIALSTLIGLKNKTSAGSRDPECVLCLDNRNYWRKSVFPLYKANRASSREKDKFDWDAFYLALNQLKTELVESSPFKVLEVDTAEADDIISVMSRRYATSYKVVIVSSDHDFLQLQAQHQNISQFSPTHRKYLKLDHRGYNLFGHIVKGDSGDGIPNILSDDDVFISPSKRSKPITKKKLEEWFNAGGISSPEKFCTSLEMLQRFNRNRKLVDLTLIPEDLSQKISSTYESVEVQKHKFFDYLVKNRLKKILEAGNF